MNDAAPPDADAILDAALRLGERIGWDAVHLHDVAADLGVPLAHIGRHYRHKDQLADAWFDRADHALLRAAEADGWAALPARERLRRALLAWFGALAAHRELTAQMLRYKLQPDHLHLHAGGVLRISRTVQWLRETALLPAVGWRREVEEAALTAIFVSTVGRWVLDRWPEALCTRAWLDRLLAAAEQAALRLGR